MAFAVVEAAERNDARERVVGAGVTLAIEEGVEDTAVERRARLLERVVGPAEEDEEGAVEEASARFRLRVSIQLPHRPSIRRLPRDDKSQDR